MASTAHGSNAAAVRLAPQVKMTDLTTTTSEKEALVRFEISDLNFFYGAKQAIFGLNLKIPKGGRQRSSRVTE